MTTPRHRLTNILGLCGLLAVGLTAGGCWSPGGRLASFDQFLFESTSFDPTTITIVDSRTGQAVWSYDVPVDKALAINFIEDVRPETTEYPDNMEWGVWPRLATGNLYERQSLDQPVVHVPSAAYRRIDKKQRPAPELPSDMTPGLPTAPPELIPKDPGNPENKPLPKPPADLVPKSEPAPAAPPVEPVKPVEAPKPADPPKPAEPPAPAPPPKNDTPPVDLPK
ncbi:MAG: hypothetical protein ACREJO_00810 [Phycisphaerales bacterium]